MLPTENRTNRLLNLKDGRTWKEEFEHSICTRSEKYAGGIIIKDKYCKRKSMWNEKAESGVVYYQQALIFREKLPNHC